MSDGSQIKRSRLDPEPIARRDVLGLAAIWSAAAAALFATFGILRLPKAAVLASPSKKFRIRLPDTMTDSFLPPGRNVAIFRDEEGVHAVSLVCTHLGCIVKTSPAGFECPCHGSRFDSQGAVTKGPAPLGLPWLKVAKSGNDFVVDEGATVPVGTKVTA
ncbi:MAG: Rieske 2Fe-2S domain-containing protein [Acidobacteria bacterium]|nr:Rieske 2Fe-2S domain-containing protein [Acidobacteriota bacterium]